MLKLVLEDCQQQELGFGLQPLGVLPTLLPIQLSCVESWPPFEEAVVVLYGPPAKELKTSVKLEDRRLVKVRRVEEDGVEMERGSGAQTDRAVKEGRAVLLSASSRKDISKAAKEGRGRSCRINMVIGKGRRATLSSVSEHMKTPTPG